MAGRKPKPTAVKKLEGNPGKRKLNKKEPIPAKGMPECPDWLLHEAKKEWERLADLMNQMGVLTEVDRAVTFIENLCHTKGKWAGTPFWLLPWQEQLIRDIFGIVKHDGSRRISMLTVPHTM